MTEVNMKLRGMKYFIARFFLACREALSKKMRGRYYGASTART